MNLENRRFNNLAYWFPILERSGVTVPKTIILHADVDADDFWSDRDRWKIDQLHAQIEKAADELGWPAFLRTAHGSGKHQWRETCFLCDPDDIPDHVQALVEWSDTVDILGLPVDTWVVRAMLSAWTYFTAFGGLPINPEARCFIRDGEVVHVMPYWSEDAFQQGMDRPDWRECLETINEIVYSEGPTIRRIAAEAAAHFAGAWSLDLMLTEKGWCAIDMAVASESWGCPPELRDPSLPTPEDDLALTPEELELFVTDREAFRV